MICGSTALAAGPACLLVADQPDEPSQPAAARRNLISQFLTAASSVLRSAASVALALMRATAPVRRSDESRPDTLGVAGTQNSPEGSNICVYLALLGHVGLQSAIGCNPRCRQRTENGCRNNTALSRRLTWAQTSRRGAAGGLVAQQWFTSALRLRRRSDSVVKRRCQLASVIERDRSPSRKSKVAPPPLHRRRRCSAAALSLIVDD